ncbi:thiamine diphosphokinase [Rhizobium bangladeshense]|uniref:thiamine diphosphokinase n=1 Tax=Rhizobium bangladeshense TaxID=1138189 RepID=UPI001C832246|nr:thiamine diphosphokinase [Rhizobium bangladeshense]MBX4869103.1 thiamine diphosphokinase [Rhizobium bangladeshense]MBX4897740.1 thiamine diphosphokinase [Rhizobium bangladeshense]MBX4904408.1 thiamine diphosphokinase [Rhizobium bangladeshense]MBX4916775.1 thiamine diphosphokinase [Rhizobium bangladeshense]MBY3583260.1 thiamine diphosphokinase [Rhizobium bangladeshense]
MSQSTFTILLGGELSPTERLRRAIGGSRFIAADGGMRHAMALGVIPELWVGDFDSTPPELEGDFLDVPKLPYPAAKAATDGEIAVSEAVARGARRLILAGALAGERSDHALQHLLSAVGLAEEGFDVLLTSGKEEAVPLLAGTIELDLPKGSMFSVSGFSELKGLSIENARYQLADFQLPFGSSRTISNVAEGKVRFSLKSGRAIVLARPYDLSGV